MKTYIEDEHYIGEILYYIKDYNVYNGMFFDWGIIDKIYHDGYSVKKYIPYDNRTIQGVPINKFKFNMEYRKLPKGWSWDTDLVQLGYIPYEKLFPNFNTNVDITKPEEIKKAIDIGFLTQPGLYAGMKIEPCINTNGYKIVCKYDKSVEDIVFVDRCYACKDIKEAIEKCKKYNDKIKAISEMSDKEYSIYEINRKIDIYSNLYPKNKEFAQETKRWLLNQDNIEDLEIRIYGGRLQYRYYGNGTGHWHNITENLIYGR